MEELLAQVAEAFWVPLEEMHLALRAVREVRDKLAAPARLPLPRVAVAVVADLLAAAAAAAALQEPRAVAAIAKVPVAAELAAQISLTQHLLPQPRLSG
jgi:hypothetical protein